MADVFISYAREDAAHAEQLARALEAAGYSCWWDRNLTPGTRYLAETEAQLKAARAVVVIWSRVSITSHWVADEAAVGRDENRLVALSFDGAMPPLGFRQFQVADLSGWQGDGAAASFRNLLAGLERLVPRGPSAGPAPVPATPAQAPAVRANLPRRLESLIGRAGELEQIAQLLKTAALVTLTGPGGIGKTRLAVEAARALTDGCEDGVWLVELAPLSDPADIPAAMARAMGLSAMIDPPAELLERLRGWRALVVLDNCEHLIEAAAAIVEQILQHAPHVRFLVTSQEVLGLEGERVVRLRSLGEGDAQQLFVRRAQSVDPAFKPTPANASAIRDICARLDGIALAIEMAGARAPALGCDTLLARLDDRFRTLTGGRRTALARQRTLIAMLDWSHSLLAPEEAVVFRRLAVFSGGFTLDAARAVACDAHIDDIAAEEVMASLSAKSLIAVHQTGARTRYRLLETMRAYAQGKLAEAGEARVCQHRHAAHFAAFLEPALGAYWGDMRPSDFTARFSIERDNLESALDWAFGPDGDRRLGAALFAHGVVLLPSRTRMRWVDMALAHSADAPRHLRERLHAARLAAAVHSFRGEEALVAQARIDVPEGADRLALTTRLGAEGVFRVVTARGQGLDRLAEEFAALAWPGGTRASLRMSLLEVIALAHAEEADLSMLRARSDELIAAARDLLDVGEIQEIYAFSETTLLPWRGDRDRAIAAARPMANTALEQPQFLDVFAGGANLSGRLACALCERAGPGDVEEATALVARAGRRHGFSVPFLRYGLAALCLADGRPADAARVIGWYLSMPLSARSTTPERQRIIARVNAALPQDRYEAALADGARMSEQQIGDLALVRDGAASICV